MDDIQATITGWLADSKSVALATVVETWGSSPRQAGAKLAAASDLLMVGSVSGGCVESAVLYVAMESIKDGQPRLLHYGVSDDTAWDVGLACGGKVTIFVEPLDVAWWAALTAAWNAGRSAVSVTIIDGSEAGRKLLYEPGNGVTFASPAFSADQCESLTHAAQAGFEAGQTGRTRLHDLGDLDVLIDVHRPPPRLIIIGGAHVAVALRQLAAVLGFRVSVIDPRRAFATEERFPEVEQIDHRYPDKALAEMGLDANTYIAVLTHDPKIDDPALRVALPSAAAYIGVMSSKRNHEGRITRLTKAGIDPALLARIHTPIGLEIGAKTPEEIALSILAEIVAVRAGVEMQNEMQKAGEGS